MLVLQNTCKHDEEKTLLSAESVMANNIGMSTMLICYDVSNKRTPSQAWIDKVHALCLTYKKKCIIECVERTGNNYQQASLMTGLISKHMDAEKCSHLLKLDADALLFNTKYIDLFARSEMMFMGMLCGQALSPSFEQVFQQAYMLSRDGVSCISKSLITPQITETTYKALYEKVAGGNQTANNGGTKDNILLLITQNTLPCHQQDLMRYNSECCFLAGWQFNDTDEKYRIYKERFDIVSYSNTFLVDEYVYGDLDTLVNTTMKKAMKVNNHAA